MWPVLDPPVVPNVQAIKFRVLPKAFVNHVLQEKNVPTQRIRPHPVQLVTTRSWVRLSASSVPPCHLVQQLPPHQHPVEQVNTLRPVPPPALNVQLVPPVVHQAQRHVLQANTALLEVLVVLTAPPETTAPSGPQLNRPAPLDTTAQLRRPPVPSVPQARTALIHRRSMLVQVEPTVDLAKLLVQTAPQATSA